MPLTLIGPPTYATAGEAIGTVLLTIVGVGLLVAAGVVVAIIAIPIAAGVGIATLALQGAK